MPQKLPIAFIAAGEGIRLKKEPSHYPLRRKVTPAALDRSENYPAFPDAGKYEHGGGGSNIGMKTSGSGVRPKKEPSHFTLGRADGPTTSRPNRVKSIQIVQHQTARKSPKND